MPKAGFEPAHLAAPPPQDGVSASSTTSANLLTSLIGLGRNRACWSCRSRSSGGRIRLLGSVADVHFRIIAGLGDQNRQRQRCDHEKDRGCCRRTAQQCAGAAGSEYRLTATAAKGAGPVRGITLLQQDNQDQENTNNNVEDREQSDHKYLMMAANDAGSRLAPPTSAPSMSSFFINAEILSGFYATAIQDAHRVRCFRAVDSGEDFTDFGMHFGGDFRCCSLPGADRPHGFVSDNNIGKSG